LLADLSRTIWATCRPGIVDAMQEHHRRFRRGLASSLVGETKSRRKAIKRSLQDRMRELEDASRPLRVRRLRTRLDRLDGQCRSQGFLFPSLKALAVSQAGEIRQELDSFDSNFAWLKEATLAEHNAAMAALAQELTLAFPPVFCVTALAFLFPLAGAGDGGVP